MENTNKLSTKEELRRLLNMFFQNNVEEISTEELDLLLSELNTVTDDKNNQLARRNSSTIDMFNARFGLIDNKVKTYEEVALMFGTTRERVRQAETVIIRRLLSLHHRQKTNKLVYKRIK